MHTWIVTFDVSDLPKLQGYVVDAESYLAAIDTAIRLARNDVVDRYSRFAAVSIPHITLVSYRTFPRS